MIKIYLRNGEERIYRREEYTDYTYDSKCFIVIRKTQWIGIYNIECVNHIEVTDDN